MHYPGLTVTRPLQFYAIVPGKRSLTAGTALRLARFFGNSPQFWMGLQSQSDLEGTEDRLGKRLEREVRPMAAAG